MGKKTLVSKSYFTSVIDHIFIRKEEIRRSGFKKEQHLSTATTFNIKPGAEEIGGEVTFKLNFELIQNKFSC